MATDSLERKVQEAAKAAQNAKMAADDATELAERAQKLARKLSQELLQVARANALLEQEDYERAWTIISGWMTALSPDEARAKVDDVSEASGVAPLVALLTRCQEGIGPDDLLDQPMFVYPSKEETGGDGNWGKSGISGATTDSKRQVLANFPKYNVRFKGWESLEEELKDNSLTPTTEEKTKKIRDCWFEMMYDSIRFSQKEKRGKRPEDVQFSAILDTIGGAVDLFGFRIGLVTGPNEDVSVTKIADDEEETIICCETKSTELNVSTAGDGPDCGRSASLCLVGFAIQLARGARIPSMENKQDSLRERLESKETGLKMRKAKVTQSNKEMEPSAYATSVLSQDENSGLEEAINDTKQMFLEEGVIDGNTPLVLWAACMQACHYSTKSNLQYSLVCSARVFWFIKLTKADSGKGCCVHISRAYIFGEASFLRKLVSFFNLADKNKKMGSRLLRRWEKALGRPPGGQGRPSGGQGDDNDGSGKDGRGGDGDRKRAAKIQRTDMPQGTTTDNKSSTLSSDLVIRRVVSDSHDHSVDMPYLDEIGEPEAELGRGRCGVVSRVKWHGQDVALKGYNLQSEEDGRYFYDVYEHELKVLRELRELWGTHVPTLLFHNPFRAGPLIGLQLGDPIKEDDMSAWNEEDRVSAEQTIKKVRECGWEQRDLRGRNFVRLLGSDGVWRIAMVDFEDMVRVQRP